MSLFSLKRFHTVLGFPLKRRKRLGNERSTGNIDLNAGTFLSIGILIKSMNNIHSEISNAFYVFHSFSRKTHHKVQLYGSPAVIKSLCAGVENFFFGNIFIYNISKPLRSCLRSKSESAFSDHIKFFNKFIGKIINSQTRKRKINIIFSCPINE